MEKTSSCFLWNNRKLENLLSRTLLSLNQSSQFVSIKAIQVGFSKFFRPTPPRISATFVMRTWTLWFKICDENWNTLIENLVEGNISSIFVSDTKNRGNDFYLQRQRERLLQLLLELIKVVNSGAFVPTASVLRLWSNESGKCYIIIISIYNHLSLLLLLVIHRGLRESFFALLNLLLITQHNWEEDFC